MKMQPIPTVAQTVPNFYKQRHWSSLTLGKTFVVLTAFHFDSDREAELNFSILVHVSTATRPTLLVPSSPLFWRSQSTVTICHLN
jgi:hypothetical protein